MNTAFPINELSPEPARRLVVRIRGAVQGVGFRPFVFRLAAQLGLAGYVNNSAAGVCIEVEGPPARLEEFLLRVSAEPPPHSYIQSLEPTWLDAVGYPQFEIRSSDVGGERTALVLPDVATCPDCLAEIFDPQNRRYEYPFTNCTYCGPRFSIIEALPYDRLNTSMRAFVMCPQCQAEYDNPRDRRFHAQPNACPACGPQLEFWDGAGQCLARKQTALESAAQAIREGAIVAVKGLGGFHLVVSAISESAVRRLRARKVREEKPFAVLFPSLESVEAQCELDPIARRLLTSPEAPIVLLRRSRRLSGQALPVSDAVAPGNPYLGVMLPYTPLHHLLLRKLGFPCVATSGNLSDEPLCIEEHEARQRLEKIADFFLVHNRPIVRQVDDSVVRVMAGRELVLRRARGYAPLPVPIPTAAPPAIAVGAHLKNTVAVTVEHNVFLSQHIGDLETALAFEAFQRVLRDLQLLYEIKPRAVAADAHPDYLSTRFARGTGLPLISVQHHHAHVLACMAENQLTPPVLGVAWDGTGYGGDGSIWGGEFLRVNATGFERVAHLRTFRLPGGEKAMKEPRRVALGLLFEAYGDAGFERHDLAPLRAFSRGELSVLKTALERGVNAPLTSSMGRLFDGVAALIGLRQTMVFEGQAAMELEFAATGLENVGAYGFCLTQPDSEGPLILDWGPVVAAILRDLESGITCGEISARLHQGLAEAIVQVAQAVGLERVLLTGGCFQNKCLCERAVKGLRDTGFRPYWHQRVPPNDGGIALGQAVASAQLSRES